MNLEKEEKRKALLRQVKEEGEQILQESGQPKEKYEEAHFKYTLKNEPPFGKDVLLNEIFLLVKEYMNGEFTFSGQAIECKFFNGQTFKLYAE